VNIIPKGPAEVIPLIFDFRARLGALAYGASIDSIAALTVDPPGALDIGVAGDAMIDDLSRIEVAVVATGGVVDRLYACTCRANVVHSGGTYVFDVVLYVLVR
jgi:hypothetical protein